MFEIQIDTLIHVHFAFFQYMHVQQSLMLINMAVPHLHLRHESSTVI